MGRFAVNPVKVIKNSVELILKMLPIVYCYNAEASM